MTIGKSSITITSSKYFHKTDLRNFNNLYNLFLKCIKKKNSVVIPIYVKLSGVEVFPTQIKKILTINIIS